MAELTPHEIDVVNEFKADLDSLMQDRMEHIGIQVTKQHFTGDNSFPTEYTVRYSFVRGMGPTLDMALADFVEKLLKHVPVEDAQKIAEYNKAMDERNKIAYENRAKPWLTGEEG